MAVNQDSVINELKLRIRLLEKQNEQLAGRMEEKLLMWLVSDTIMESGDPAELLDSVLERISVLLDIPYSCCYQINNYRLEPLGAFSEFDEEVADFFKIHNPDTLIDRISEDPIFLTKSDFEKEGVNFHKKLEIELEHVSFFPFQSIYHPFGVFVFFETHKDPSVLPSLSLVIRQLVFMAVEKLEKLNLLQELKDLNYTFEDRVKQRTEKLLGDQSEPEDKKIKQHHEKTTASLISSTTPDKIDTLFMRNIGIEVRTPVNGIMGFAELLREQDLSDYQQNKYIDIIKSCGKSMLKVIDDAVDYAFIKSKKIQLKPTEFKLASFLTDLYDQFKVDELFRQRENLDLKLNINVNGNTLIKVDRDRLRQIMVNLIGNAIKFTSEGFIEIGCYIKHEQSEKTEENDLLFFVKDTGVGIPGESAEQVFEPFYKIEYEISRLYGGMGLGLSIAKELCTLMEGRIWFNSKVGEGSAFYISLPKALIESHDKEEEKKDKSMNRAYEWDDKKFLVVEDDEMSYIYLREILKSTGVELLLAKDGKGAVEKVKENQAIDLVLMDIKLPGMSGFEAIGIIKSIIDVPIIVQTAYAMADDHKRIIETGCDDYITKPINRKDLLESIARVLKKPDSKSGN